MTTLKTPEEASQYFRTVVDKARARIMVTEDRQHTAQVLCGLLEGEKGRWVAAYMPADEGKDPSKWGFGTEEEAWNWIEKRLTPCPLDPKDKSGKPCDSCMAEWMVYQIPETDQAITKAQAIIRQTLDPISNQK